MGTDGFRCWSRRAVAVVRRRRGCEVSHRTGILGTLAVCCELEPHMKPGHVHWTCAPSVAFVATTHTFANGLRVVLYTPPRFSCAIRLCDFALLFQNCGWLASSLARAIA